MKLFTKKRTRPGFSAGAIPFRPIVVLLCFAALVLLTPMGGRLEERAHERDLGQMRLAEPGDLFAVLGGFRSVVADLHWIRAQLYWEQKDLDGTEEAIALATRWDPSSVYFWINGARMITYDVAAWPRQGIGSDRDLGGGRSDEIRRVQANKGLRLIQRAKRYHPDDPRLPIEEALIYLQRLENTERAAEAFRRASEKPGAPYFCARIYGELLRRMGRLEEAYRFYRALYPTLPAGNPRARREVVRERIQDLEGRIGLKD